MDVEPLKKRLIAPHKENIWGINQKRLGWNEQKGSIEGHSKF